MHALRNAGRALAWLPPLVYIAYLVVAVGSAVLPLDLHAAGDAGGAWVPPAPDWTKITPSGNPAFVSNLKKSWVETLSFLSLFMAGVCFFICLVVKFRPGFTFGSAFGWFMTSVGFAGFWALLTWVLSIFGRDVSSPYG